VLLLMMLLLLVMMKTTVRGIFVEYSAVPSMQGIWPCGPCRFDAE